MDGVWVNQIRINGVLETYDELVGNLAGIIINVRTNQLLIKAIVRSNKGGEAIYGHHLILPKGTKVLNPRHYICTVINGYVWRSELTFARYQGREDRSMFLKRNLQGCRRVFPNSNFVVRAFYRVRRELSGYVLEMAFVFSEDIDAMHTVMAAIALVRGQLQSVTSSLAELEHVGRCPVEY